MLVKLLCASEEQATASLSLTQKEERLFSTVTIQDPHFSFRLLELFSSAMLEIKFDYPTST